MTEAQFIQQLNDCNWANNGEVSKLISSSYTNVMFNDKVMEMQIANPMGAQNFFSGFFGTEVWKDGQGNDQIREYATDPFIPFTFSHFARQMDVCDPSLANRCDVDLCEVPEGGRGTMPGMEWFQWGFETKRTCVANIRHIRDFQYWAAKVIRNRTLIDEQVMYMFYVMAALRTTGHKITMQGERDAAGNLFLKTNNNPRNASGYGDYNYMQKLFPAITSVGDLAPMQWEFLEALARRWENFPAANSNGNRVATNSRGGGVYELWHPDDLYQQEVLRNPDYMKSLVHTMPNSLFAGYSLQPGNSEIIGNWKLRTMSALPRFAPTIEGSVAPVDTHVNIAIEVGNEPVPNPDWMDAPIGLAMVVNRRQGTIMTRPTLSQSGEGFPIQPIASSEPWQINNEYDEACNKFKNKPFSYRRYEMGFRLDDPNAATAFLFRRRVFPRQPIADCDLAPMFLANDNGINCPLTQIGCGGGVERIQDEWTQPENAPTRVECTYTECDNDGVSPYRYDIRVKRIPNNPDFNSLACGCGDAVQLFVYDAAGAAVKTIAGVVKTNIKGYPYGIYGVETTVALAEGQCIRYIACSDATPFVSNVVTAWDSDTDPMYSTVVGVRVVLDDPMGCSAVGQSVKVRYYTAGDVLVGSELTTTLNYVDVDSNTYGLADTAGLEATVPSVAKPTAAYFVVACNVAPNLG